MYQQVYTHYSNQKNNNTNTVNFREREREREVVMMKEEGKLNGNGAPAAHFVLIHGIGGGAWCWYKMKCLMENCGYKVTCLDLKGAGMDQTDPNAVVSFEDYNQPLLDFLSSLHDHQQVFVN